MKMWDGGLGNREMDGSVGAPCHKGPAGPRAEQLSQFVHHF